MKLEDQQAARQFFSDWNMNIDFSEIGLSVLPGFKGGEKELRAKMFFDGTNRIMQGLLVPGASIGMHTHEDSCEVIFVTAGRGTVVFDGEASPVHAGLCHYCPKGHTHSLVNDSDADLEFLAVVPRQ